MPEFNEPTIARLPVKGLGHALVLNDSFSRDVLCRSTWADDGAGYPRGRCQGRRGVRLHQIVFAHYHGDVPRGRFIDHEDKDRLNNLPGNLRALTRAQNNRNRDVPANRSGFRCVYEFRKGKKPPRWAALVLHSGYPWTRQSFPFTEEGRLAAARFVNAVWRERFPDEPVPNPGVEPATSDHRGVICRAEEYPALPTAAELGSTMGRFVKGVKARLSHGHCQDGRLTRTYTIWASMIDRCRNTKSKRAGDYVGRAIDVCARWRTFENFLADMGECPAELQLDRIDNGGDYEPANCKWSTRKEQGRNKRNNRLLTAFGRTQCLPAWADETGIPPATIRARIKYGWSMEETLTRAVRIDSRNRPAAP